MASSPQHHNTTRPFHLKKGVYGPLLVIPQGISLNANGPWHSKSLSCYRKTPRDRCYIRMIEWASTKRNLEAAASKFQSSAACKGEKGRIGVRCGPGQPRTVQTDCIAKGTTKLTTAEKKRHHNESLDAFQFILLKLASALLSLSRSLVILLSFSRYLYPSCPYLSFSVILIPPSSSPYSVLSLLLK